MPPKKNKTKARKPRESPKTKPASAQKIDAKINKVRSDAEKKKAKIDAQAEAKKRKIDADVAARIAKLRPTKSETLYDILGVSRNATTAEIKTAYRTLMKKNHPDKGGDTEVAKRLVGAYEILVDPDKRKAYDAKL